MSAPVCSSQVQCRLNGVFGTAVALCAAVLAWVAVDRLTSGAPLLPALAAVLGLWLLPLGPSLASVGLWAAMRAMGWQRGWLATAAVCAGAVWGVVALNGLERL